MGYQIRLESCVSPKTCLTFGTYGVLLRSLMGGDAILASLTHVIIDEVDREEFGTDLGDEPTQADPSSPRAPWEGHQAPH